MPHEARWWQAEEGCIRCELCPRGCLLREGQRGLCGVRAVREGTLRSLVYGATTPPQADPVEKKPLFHFLPGARLLSFGTLGCNLDCAFCQNWPMSHPRGNPGLIPATPEGLVAAAREANCAGVAFTYNEPTVFAEFALDVAQACREAGLRTVAVTSGYISGRAREAFFRGMDAANVDLKAFTEQFYRRVCGGSLRPVLETLEYLARETKVWLELSTLLIPGANDGPDEVSQLAAYVARALGQECPLHLTGFHPDFRMQDRPATPLEALRRSREIARAEGLHHVYTGNLRDPEGGTTYCPSCGRPVVERDGYVVTTNRLVRGRCPECRGKVAGVWHPEGAPRLSPPHR